MSTGICTCGTLSFGNLGEANCVVSQAVMYQSLFMPRYLKDGSRNTIDVGLDPLLYLNPAGVAGDLCDFRSVY